MGYNLIGERRAGTSRRYPEIFIATLKRI